VEGNVERTTSTPRRRGGEVFVTLRDEPDAGFRCTVCSSISPAAHVLRRLFRGAPESWTYEGRAGRGGRWPIDRTGAKCRTRKFWAFVTFEGIRGGYFIASSSREAGRAGLSVQVGLSRGTADGEIADIEGFEPVRS